MLHAIITEQGNCLDVRDGISEKILFFTCFPINLLPALILGIIVIADIKPIALTDVINNILSHTS